MKIKEILSKALNVIKKYINTIVTAVIIASIGIPGLVIYKKTQVMNYEAVYLGNNLRTSKKYKELKKQEYENYSYISLKEEVVDIIFKQNGQTTHISGYSLFTKTKKENKSNNLVTKQYLAKSIKGTAKDAHLILKNESFNNLKDILNYYNTNYYGTSYNYLNTYYNFTPELYKTNFNIYITTPKSKIKKYDDRGYYLNNQVYYMTYTDEIVNLDLKKVF